MPGQILGGQGILSNPLIATLSPDQQQNLVQLQQRQAIGQALLEQGLQPLDTGNAQVGGMAYHVSPLNGVAKLLQAYVGNKLSMDSVGQQAGLMSQMVGKPFFGDNTQAQSTDAGGGPTLSLPPSSANDTVPMQGVSAGLGLNAPTPIQLGQAMGGQQPAAHYGPMTLPGTTPQESMQIFAMVGRDAYSRMLTQWAAPTDATRMAQQGGLDITQANRDALFKANFVAPITGTGIFRDPRTMQPTAYNPNIPDGSTPLFDASGNVAQVSPITGAQGVMQGNAAATAAGGAQFKFTQKYNPATHQMEWLPDASLSAQTTPGAAPTLNGIFAQQESSGGKTAPDNPMQIQQGTFNQYKQGGESWNNPADRTAVAQRVLANYNQKYGGDLGRIATAYFSGEGNVAPAGSPTPFIKNTSDANGKTVSSYVGDIMGRAGGSGFGSSGGVAAAPPLGITSNADTAQQASAKTMHDSYSNLLEANSSANSALEALQKMQAIAQGKTVFSTGALGTMSTSVNSDAAEYEKQRANVISLLSKQNGTNGDVAGRALTGESVPDYGKPKSAILDGLQTLINQTRVQQMKANLLTPAYNAGDSKTYTQLENEFNQNIGPGMVPILTMPAGPARAKTLEAVSKDPVMKTRLNWAVENGLLK